MCVWLPPSLSLSLSLSVLSTQLTSLPGCAAPPVPPRAPVIFDEHGHQTVDDRIGPYREGQAVNITCAVFEGELTDRSAGRAGEIHPDAEREPTVLTII